MWFHGKVDVDVARGATISSGVAFIAEAHLITFIYTWWNGNREFALYPFFTATFALAAWVVNHRAFAIAVWTGGAVNETAEKALLGSAYFAITVTVRTFLRACSWLAAKALTDGAVFDAPSLELLLYTEDSFLKRKC